MRIHHILLFSMMLGLCFVWDIQAQDLKKDYRAIEKRREDIERKRAEYEQRLEELTDQLNKVAGELNNCIYNTRMKTLNARQRKIYESWRIIWESRLNEAEFAREAVETERRELRVLWQELGAERLKYENHRVDIERNYENRVRDQEYENQFRAYMADISKNYLDRIENELFIGYEDYLTQADGYLVFLTNSLDLCNNYEIRLPSN